jgi:hypothetical protein
MRASIDGAPICAPVRPEYLVQQPPLSIGRQTGLFPTPLALAPYPVSGALWWQPVPAKLSSCARRNAALVDAPGDDIANACRYPRQVHRR